MAKKVAKKTKKKAVVKRKSTQKVVAKKAVNKKTVKKAARKKMAKKKTTKKVVKAKKAVKKTTKKKTVKKTVKKVVKKAVKKSPARRKQIGRAKNIKPLTAVEIDKFKNLLLQKRAELLGDVDSMENEALRKSRLESAGDLSSMPIHMADIGTDNYEQEFALGLLDSERKILQEIDASLERISEGTYGICEGTGNPIKRVRLEANPWARYCIEYARMVEQGLVVEGERVDEYDDDEDLEDIEGLGGGDDLNEDTDDDDTLSYGDGSEEEEEEDERMLYS